MRLSPWLPEHSTYIESRIAALEIEDPTAANRFRLAYAEIMGKYFSEHPEEAIAELPAEIKELAEEVPIPGAEHDFLEDGTTEKTFMTEEEFRALPASEQKDLVKDKVTEEGQDSNADKRVALYFGS